MASKLTTTIDEIGDTIERAVRHDLKAMIKAKLLASVDEVIENMAIQLAENILVRIETMNTIDGFGPQTNVVVNFNLKKPPMMYDTKTKEVRERTVLDE